MKKHLLSILILSLLIIFTACKKTDEERVCEETNVTMMVDGELQSFQAMGRGIDMVGDGYTLSINLDRRSESPFREQAIVLYLPYKKTGKDLITKFLYHQYINSVGFDGDFMTGEFHCNIITNTKYCINASFSGKLSDGTQEVVITDGKLNYQYEEPFDD